KEYLVGNLCKPHDCGNNFLIVAFSADKSQAWGVRVEVGDRPEAVDHPKKYAKYQWLGKPDEDMKALLKQQFENNPDWK
ncbi:Ivy family c-type lysozyme inhibitor, partial [Escherichia coli]|uniref:Ivy family c-type lysozyme inhibitor n=1 Tax=Escherichia coli TaxID=562 RepID=UPI0022841A00